MTGWDAMGDSVKVPWFGARKMAFRLAEEIADLNATLETTAALTVV